MLSVKDLQHRIDQKGSRLAVLLYADTQPRIATFLPIARAIRDAGHVVIVVCSFVPCMLNSDLVGFEDVPVEQAAAEDIGKLDRVDLFFSCELVFGVAPRDAVTLGVIHSLPDYGLKRDDLTTGYWGAIDYSPTIIREFDYLLIPIRQTHDAWSVDCYRRVQGFFPPEMLASRRATLDIVPAGYPKLDFSDRGLANPGQLDVILYSPTSIDSQVSRIESDGRPILAALLEHFPDHTIAFRPYPKGSDVDYARSLIASFAHQPRLVLDESGTGLDLQRRSAVCVSDSSSSAVTFALASSRPLVFVKLDSRASNTVAAIQNPIGYRTQSIPGLISAVREACESGAHWRSRIEQARRQFLYNPGEASSYIANNLPVFAARGTREDWLSIPRTPWLDFDDPDRVAKHLADIKAMATVRISDSAKDAYESIVRYVAGRSSFQSAKEKTAAS